ncbi:hypothetical protein M9458_033254, partial [Cirrhinus mrigala]
AIGMLQGGMTQREVADTVGTSQSVISRAWNRFRSMVEADNGNRFMPAVSLQNDLQDATGVRVSTQTVRRRLHEVGLRARRPAVRVPPSGAHKLARLQWTLNQWGTVLFTDESRFCMNFLDRRRRVWRRPGERNLPQNVVQHDRIGGSTVMVWGGISMGARTELVIIENGSLTGQRYRDEILRPVVRPYAGAMWPDFVLMDDNAGPHRARLVTEFLEEEGISRMEWPAQSPDLNPIEHIWEQLQSRVQALQVPLGTRVELRTTLLEEWQAIPQQNI